ncbi:small-conductance mechanosensitive channel [Salinicoccus roseus]|uniref:Small-conductance mechanosensitive channel n=1 Tax=Salinicoccus roseus TaxID=45670 RepID=A0A265EAP0_9STAP|nr:small-conductance mechanosensitive channel [Salinicoccus roseus]OZT78545.1 small-conductance mechanosensitive channel [Salinicoccus roseus]
MNNAADQTANVAADSRISGTEASSMEVFYRRSHFWGRLTLLVIIIMSLIPPLYISFVLDAHPGWGVIATGLVGYASFIGIMWVLEPITYYPTLGVAGTYLAFLTGNIANMCLPCSSAAQKSVDAAPGSQKAEVAGVFGIAVASLTNIILLVIMIIGGTYLISMFPPFVEGMFGFVLPSIFGAVLGQFAYRTPKYGVIALVIGMAVLFSPIFSLIKIALCVALTIAVVLFMEKKKGNLE